MKLPNLWPAARISVLSIAAVLPQYPLPATADGDAATVPITIDHCTIAEQATLANPKIGVRIAAAGGLTIVYTNDRDVAASEVHFRVRYQAQTLTFVDRGSIAPHTKISREFNNFSAAYYGSSADCSVTSATFADGTRWDPVIQAQTPAPRR